MRTFDLFREMENLRREVDSAFQNFGAGNALASSFLPGLGLEGYPQVNVSEDGDNLFVLALLPGLEPQDVEVNVIRNALTISGERRETETVDKTWHRRERGGGKFMRTIDLPMAVVAEKARAEYHDGILTITLPKAEEAKPKKISVTID